MLSHVKWYLEEPAASIDVSFVFHPMTLVLLAGAVVIAIMWRLTARRLEVPELAFLHSLSRLAPWVPRLLAVHLGVSLLALAVANAYLAPHLSLDDVRGGWLIALLEGMIGVWLITGVRLRPASLLVVGLGPLGLLLEGPVPVLESVDLLGLALFLALLPPGRDSHGASAVRPRDLLIPLLLLRLAVGTAMIVLAFSEKLLVPDLARELVGDRPYLDPFQQLGLAGDADLFIRVASATELLIGLLIVSGAAPQLVVIFAAIPFNVTLIFFDRLELIGHLPIYGALLALLIYGSSPKLGHVVCQFRLPSRHDRRGP